MDDGQMNGNTNETQENKEFTQPFYAPGQQPQQPSQPPQSQGFYQGYQPPEQSQQQYSQQNYNNTYDQQGAPYGQQGSYGYQQQYQPGPGYMAPQPQQEGKGMSIAAMVCGILSIVFCAVIYLALPCGVVGLVLGIIARKKSKNGMALAGIITGSIGIGLTLIVTIAFIAAVGSLWGYSSDYYGYWPDLSEFMGALR